MKTSTILILTFAFLLLVAGCAAPEPAQPVAEESAALLAFKSEEEFLNAVKQAKSGKDEQDIANLKDLQSYAVLAAVPPGYSLYLIAAGTHGLGFTYLADQHLTSADAALEAMVGNNCYDLIIYRDTKLSNLASGYNWAETAVTRKYLESAKTSDKYYTAATGWSMVYWEQDGICMSLQFPANEKVTIEGTTGSVFDIAEAKTIKLD